MTNNLQAIYHFPLKYKRGGICCKKCGTELLGDISNFTLDMLYRTVSQHMLDIDNEEAPGHA